MFGAILSRTRSARADDLGPHSGQQPQAAPEWVSQVLRQLEPLQPGIPGDSEYLAAFDGDEVNLTSAQYERLIADKDNLLQHAALLVDRAAGYVFVKGDGGWQYSTSASRTGPPELEAAPMPCCASTPETQGGVSPTRNCGCCSRGS